MSQCDQCYGLKISVDNGLKVLQWFTWLLDSFVLDYYTENHWKNIPVKWRHLLDGIEPQELGELLDPRNLKGSFQRVWPLSFLALRSAALQLSVSRQQCQNHESRFINCIASSGVEKLHTCNLHYKRQQISWTLKASSIPSSTNGLLSTHSDLHHVFIKHVKVKKRHEISSMAQITAETALAAGCQFVVDVGSGLGHLARMLAYGYGLHVCCLEAQDTLSEQAKKLDLELEISLSKHILADEMSRFHRPVHLHTVINFQTEPVYFVKALSKAFGNVDEATMNFGIVGLHPCGDLGPILLQLFTKCPNAKFINIVGCCYMKISVVNERETHFKGYPLSMYVFKKPHLLSYEAREIACHAIENYCQRLHSGDINHLKVHSYRATLERILVKYWPHLRHSGIRSIKHAHQMSFQDYCMAATSKLGVELPQEELVCEETLDNLAQWKRVVTLYSLRLMLAPLIETILLLDRLLYLQERGVSSVLLPVFDPSLSPRNHILVAAKQM